MSLARISDGVAIDFRKIIAIEKNLAGYAVIALEGGRSYESDLTFEKAVELYNIINSDSESVAVTRSVNEFVG